MKIIKGDLLSVEKGIIVHGVNCQGVMGSGVAKAIRAKWPMVYTLYRNEYMSGLVKLGDVGFVIISDDLVVANAYTQEYYGSGGKRYVSYDAIESCFERIKNLAGQSNLPVHYPKIGAGLGGGDWKIISKIINQIFGEAVEHYLWEL